MATNTKPAESAILPVAYSKTTTETITENFKDLMAEVDERLIKEFEAKRITGTEYANVYMSSIQTVLQLASQVETFEAKRASHARQWKLKVFGDLASSHSMTSNVLGSLDVATILPYLKGVFNDMFETLAPAYVPTELYSIGDIVSYTVGADTQNYTCTLVGTPAVRPVPTDSSAWSPSLAWN